MQLAASQEKQIIFKLSPAKTQLDIRQC